MRVLVVEDQAEIRNFLKSSLEAECFSVDVAADGEKGFLLAKTTDYDLIILDNVMPKKTGLEVCGDLRRHGKTTPILILSANSEVSSKVELLNAGADDYLSKPFSLEELIARMRALLRRPNQFVGDVLEIKNVVLDSKKQTVTVDGEEVHLTRKEFMLLEYLMRNQGTVLSRGMIMEHVWDMNADPFSNTIESHILSLRRKLGGKLSGSAKNDLIQTVSGRGYRMDSE